MLSLLFILMSGWCIIEGITCFVLSLTKFSRENMKEQYPLFIKRLSVYLLYGVFYISLMTISIIALYYFSWKLLFVVISYRILFTIIGWLFSMRTIAIMGRKTV